MAKLIWNNTLEHYDNCFKNIVNSLRQESERIAKTALTTEERNISDLCFGFTTSSNNILKIWIEEQNSALFSKKSGIILYGLNTSCDSEDYLKIYCVITLSDYSTYEIISNKDGSRCGYSVYFNGNLIGSVFKIDNNFSISDEYGHFGICDVDKKQLFLQNGTTIKLPRFSAYSLIKRGMCFMYSLLLSSNSMKASFCNNDTILPKFYSKDSNDVLLFIFSIFFRCKFFHNNLLPDV